MSNSSFFKSLPSLLFFCPCAPFFFFFFAFGCSESSLLHLGFLQLWRAGFTLGCSAGASHCRGFSLWNTASRCSGSVVVVCGLDWPVARGIFPDQGSNLCPLHWQADSYPLYHQGSLISTLLHSEVICISSS